MPKCSYDLDEDRIRPIRERALAIRRDIEVIEVELKEVENHLAREKAKLEALEESCGHDWDREEYAPIHKAGYQLKGDPPGTMGVDRELPIYVQPETIDRWRRVCRKCDRVEYTVQSQEILTRLPVFPR